MKLLLVLVMGVLLVGTVANASEIISDNEAGPGTAWPGARMPWVMTQNTGNPIQLTAGVYSCGNVTLGYTTESWSLRRFSPYWDYGLDGPFTVSDIDWGVRRFAALLDSIPNPITVTVELYSISAYHSLLWANLSLISSTPVVITPADNPIPPSVGTWKYTAVNSVFDPLSGARDLVVAIHQPEGYSSTPAMRFACSADNVGETAESYYVFSECGYPEPVTPSDLGGSPGVSQLVLVASGHLCCGPPGACCDHSTGNCTVETQNICTHDWLGVGIPCNAETCPVPVPVEITSWGRVKAIYRGATRQGWPGTLYSEVRAKPR